MILPRTAEVLPRATEALNTLATRQTYCSYRYGYGYYHCNSAWYRWGRWVLAGVLIFIGLIILALILCISAHRRRRGRNNYGATSTPMASQPASGSYQQTQPQQEYTAPSGPPPIYGGGGGENYGYSGQQGVVTQPSHTYQK